MREGLQGFARAALAGGYPCLVASKWDVPANESVMLMRSFYGHMALNRVRACVTFRSFFFFGFVLFDFSLFSVG